MRVFFDIIFQSGEFINPDNSWLTSLLITIVGAGIGSGATIWALYRTFRHDKERDYAEQLKYQKEKVNYLRALVGNTVKGLASQIKHIGTFVETIKETPYDLPLLTKIPLNDMKRVVHKINQEDYYHAYLREFKNSEESVEEFRQLYSLLDYFDASLDSMEEALKKSMEFDYERKVKYQNLIDKTMDECAQFLLNPSFRQQTDFINLINSCLLNYHANKTDHSGIEYAQASFVNVMKTGLMPLAATIPEALYVLRELKNATYIYSNIILQNQAVAEDFQKVAGSYEKYYKELESVSQKLREYDGSK